MARPLLTPALQDEIVQNLTLGMTISDTCAQVGITHATYDNWCNRGRRAAKNDAMYVSFFEAVTRARVQARRSAVATIRRAMSDGDTDSAQWYLERSDPANWGKRVYLEGGLSQAQVNRAIRAMLQAGLDPVKIFEDIIQETVNASADVYAGDSAEGD